MSKFPPRPVIERELVSHIERRDQNRTARGSNRLRVGVVGLGPVGAVSAACLSASGHTVVAVERNPDRRARFAAGEGPCVEPGLDDLLVTGLASGAIRIGTMEDIATCELSLVCVGTPVTPDGRVGLEALTSACAGLGAALKASPGHVVVIGSTVPPGTTVDRMTPILRDASGRADLPVAFWPEFLREAVAIRDFTNPSYTVFGVTDDVGEQALRTMIAPIDSAPIFVPPAEAEALKIASNAWHATKIAFANEIGRVVETVGADGAAVMELLCKDTALNISPRYLRPGFAYGGSCLPKDLRALQYMGAAAGVATPLLGGTAASNRAHIDQVAQRIADRRPDRVALLGVAFKPGTDDLRESPSLELAAALEQRGIRLRLHDPLIRGSDLPPSAGCLSEAGEEVFRRLPDLLAPSLEVPIRDADLIVVVHDTQTYRDALQNTSGTPVISIAHAAMSHPAEAEYAAARGTGGARLGTDGPADVDEVA